MHARVLLVAFAVAACQGKSGGAGKHEPSASAAEPEQEARGPAAGATDVSGVRLGELLVEGARDGGAILEVVHEQRGVLARCFREARASNPELAGQLGIRFFVKPDGSVPDAILHNAEITDRGMQRCVMNAFKSLKFPEASGDARATLPIFFGESGPERAG